MKSTDYSEAQQVFWDIHERLAGAEFEYKGHVREFVRAHNRDDALGCQIHVPAMIEARHAKESAEDALRAFAREHDGESFLVFRPEHIDAAISEDIAPLFLKRFGGS